VQIALFSGFFIAFAIKAPLVPFHTWLPDAGAEAPVGGAVLLVGILDKVGTFGFLRYCLPLFPEASRILGPYVIALCVLGILYGALLAMGSATSSGWSRTPRCRTSASSGSASSPSPASR
jgi:NADH-quinone oxidoreductase subunit M